MGERYPVVTRVSHIGGDIEDVENSTPSRHRSLSFIDSLTHYLNRLDEELDEEEKCDNRPDGR